MRFGRVFAAPAMHVVHVLGLRVVLFQIFIIDGPGRRDSAIMLDLAEVFASQTKQGRPVEFCIAANVVVRVRMQLAAIFVVPDLFRVVLTVGVDSLRAPIVLLAANVIAPFEQENPFPRRGQTTDERTAACAGPACRPAGGLPAR